MADASKTFLDYYPFGRTEFQFNVKDVAKLDKKGVKSETYTTGDIDWNLNVVLNEEKKEKHLSAFLYCNAADIVNAWEIEAQFRIVLENKKNEKQSIARQMDFVFLCETDENRGWSKFAEFDQVMDKENGFLDDEDVSFRVMVGVKSTKGFESPRYFDFTVNDKMFSDVTLLVDGFHFYMNKMMLSVHSPVIGELILSAKEDETIVINDVDRQEFHDFVQLLYAVPIRIDKNNIAFLLKLSSRFDTKGLKNMCEMYLQQAATEKTLTMAECVKIANDNDLPNFVNLVVNEAKTSEELAEKFGNLEVFDSETIKKVIDRSLSFV